MLLLIHSLPGFKLHLITSSYSPITTKNYLTALTLFAKSLNNPPVDQITQTDIINFFEQLRQNHRSESTVQAYWKIIRSYFNWAAQEFHLQRPDNIPMPQPAPPPIYPFTV
ncbi:MAG TPA: phage integrase N-terminal SAM-like domain-containing protein, partial [Flexilinea sp.]|nr:phage integrase N-terminal SAM-like domain-containing protein [Flexilinea sp.]